jgi:hypothetical protein
VREGHSAVQTPRSLPSSTPRKVNLRKQLHIARVALCRSRQTAGTLRERVSALRKLCKQKSVLHTRVNNVVKSAAKFLTGDSLKLFEMQLRQSLKKSKGRRYSDDDKLLALSLYNHGAKAYRFIAGISTLPSKTTLSVWLQSMQMQPGFPSEVLQAIACKVKTMSPRDRVCALLVDEMALKSSLSYDQVNDVVVGYEDCGSGFVRKKMVVTSALVFMIRGLAANWKQAVGFVLTGSTCKTDLLRNLICQCLDHLQSVGLNVKVVISDQGSNFQSVTKTLGVTVNTPFFEHKGKTYLYMFDPPHLLKSIRNNLFKYSILFGDSKMAKWSDITTFFARDEQQKYRLAPKLTKKHVELPAFSKMKVKLASQVFSRTVAAGLETHSCIAGASASETAEFLATFNDLFDAVNSSRLRDSNKLRSAISQSTSHMQFFVDNLDWLKTLCVVNS